MRIATAADVAHPSARHALDALRSRRIAIVAAAGVLLLAGFLVALKLATPAGAPIRSPEPGTTVLAAGRADPR